MTREVIYNGGTSTSCANFCMKHPEEEMDMYCKQCKKPTCNECMKSDHIGHDFDSIAKMYRKINNKRSDLISDWEREISAKGSHNREHLGEVNGKNELSTKTYREHIKKKRAELHKAVDDFLDSHEHSLDSHSAKLRDKINEQETAFEVDESVVLKMVETFKKTTMKGLDLIEYCEELKSKVHALPTIDVSNYYNKQVYVTNEFDGTILQKLIGEIRESSRNTPTVKQLSAFRHRESLAHTICPLSKEEAWITYDDARKFELLRIDGHRIKKVTKNTNKHSFVLQNGSFILCNSDDNNILKIDVTGKKNNIDKCITSNCAIYRTWLKRQALALVVR